MIPSYAHFGKIFPAVALFLLPLIATTVDLTEKLAHGSLLYYRLIVFYS